MERRRADIARSSALPAGGRRRYFNALSLQPRGNAPLGAGDAGAGALALPHAGAAYPVGGGRIPGLRSRRSRALFVGALAAAVAAAAPLVPPFCVAAGRKEKSKAPRRGVSSPLPCAAGACRKRIAANEGCQNERKDAICQKEKQTAGRHRWNG